MSEALLRYLAGEKAAALGALVVGAAALAASAVLAASGSAFARGMAAGLGAVALLQVAAGCRAAWRAGAQHGRLQAHLTADPATFRAAEAARLGRTRARLRSRTAAAVALVLAALGVLVAVDRPAWAGVAAGFIVQAGVALVFDLLAERRAQAYARAVGAVAV